MNFVTIDFETAQGARNTPCEIGLTFVEEGEVVETNSYLIKPKCYPDFDFFNMEIHGIKPSDVEDAPEFPDIWDQISNLIDGKFILAHYASFDISVLRSTLDLYNLPYPNLDFSCTYQLSKKVYPELGIYRLEYLSHQFQLGGHNHHRAGTDSLKAARLALNLLNKTGSTGIHNLLENVAIRHGNLSPNSYKPSETIRAYHSKKEKYGLDTIISDPTKHNPDSIFYQKEVVFTGSLDSMIRKDAAQIIADLGGYPSESLKTTTNFLICGRGNMAEITPDNMTGKFKKAVGFAAKGHDIEIIDEEAFLQNI